MDNDNEYEIDNPNPYNLTVQHSLTKYRSPEVLSGLYNYSYSIDLWAFGCIFMQMCTKNGKLLFDENCDFRQIMKIFEILGGPQNELDNIGYLMKTFEIDKNKKFNTFDKILNEYLDNIGNDFISKIMLYNPNKRISAKNALEHSFLKDINKNDFKKNVIFPCDDNI